MSNPHPNQEVLTDPEFEDLDKSEHGSLEIPDHKQSTEKDTEDSLSPSKQEAPTPQNHPHKKR